MIKRKLAELSRRRLVRTGASMVVISAIAIVSMASLGMGMGIGNSKGGEHSLLSVNGIEVPEEEFRLFLQDEKANVADYFYKTHGAEYDGRFWETNYGGENPLEVAKAKALSKLVQVKVEQQLAVQYEVLPSAEYKLIHLNMNKAESIYGAESLEPFENYMLYHSKALLDARNKYKADADPIREEDLRQYYEENRTERFKTPDELEALIIRLAPSDEESTGEAVHGIVRNLVRDIHSGEAFEDLQSRFTSPYILDIQKKQYGSTESKEEHSSGLGELLKENAYTLEPNQMSDPIIYSNDRYVVVCLARTAGNDGGYEAVKLSIEDLLQEKQFELLISDTVGSAETVIHDQQQYEQIAMQ